MDLRGAVAVVTGASSGFGELTATALAREGASVVLAARRLERLEALAGRIRERGGRALPVRCDVAEPDEIRALQAEVAREFGRCDVLINNAGIPSGGPFTDATREQIERVTRVNYLGVVHGTRAFLPMMMERGRGHVVNIASLAGRFATPGAVLYTASKHAVVAFSEALYYELAPHGILVTTVNPAFAATEGFPQEGGRPSLLTLTPERVAGVIVKVVRVGIAPEYSIPRWVAPLEAFRVLTPPLYRWGMNIAARRYSG